MCRAYRPSLPLDIICQTLGFFMKGVYVDGLARDLKKYKRGRKVGMTWLKSQGVLFSDGENVDCKLTLQVVVAKVQDGLDIKGQL